MAHLLVDTSTHFNAHHSGGRTQQVVRSDAASMGVYQLYDCLDSRSRHWQR
jgi:hypothetical protein